MPAYLKQYNLGKGFHTTVSLRPIAEMLAGHRAHMTSPLRMGNGSEREEPRIIILGDLDEVYLCSKMWVWSASTESRTVTSIHFQPLSRKQVFIFSIEKRPLYLTFLVSLVIYGRKNL